MRFHQAFWSWLGSQSHVFLPSAGNKILHIVFSKLHSCNVTIHKFRECYCFLILHNKSIWHLLASVVSVHVPRVMSGFFFFPSPTVPCIWTVYQKRWIMANKPTLPNYNWIIFSPRSFKDFLAQEVPCMTVSHQFFTSGKTRKQCGYLSFTGRSFLKQRLCNQELMEVRFYWKSYCFSSNSSAE